MAFTKITSQVLDDGAVTSSKLAPNAADGQIADYLSAIELITAGDLATAVAAIPTGIRYIYATSNITAENYDGILANTSGGAFTVTLPANPTMGYTVVVSDAGDFSANILTVARNGETIEGDAEDMNLDIPGVSVTFVYTGSDWQIFTQAGAMTTNYNEPQDYGLLSESPTAAADYGDIL